MCGGCLELGPLGALFMQGDPTAEMRKNVATLSCDHVPVGEHEEGRFEYVVCADWETRSSGQLGQDTR